MKFIKIIFLLICLQIIQSSTCFSQGYNLTTFPQNYQLYPRNSSNKATVNITGSITNSNYKSVSLVVLKNNFPYYNSEVNTVFVNQLSQISFSVEIEAELSEYTFTLYLKDFSQNNILASKAEKILCGDILLFYGQSNAVNANGFDNVVNTMPNNFIRNFDFPDPTNVNPGALQWYPAGLPYAQIGTSAYVLAHLLATNHHVPIGVINGAVGGAALSALSYKNPTNKFDTSNPYGKLLTRIKNAGALSFAKLLVFRQGENEAGNACFYCPQYPSNFNVLYNNLLTDLPNLQKIYEGQNNILDDNYVEMAGRLRDFQRKAQTIYPKITSFSTVGTQEYVVPHYGGLGNIQTAQEIFRIIARDFYGSTDNNQITSPDIQNAFFNTRRDTVTLVFEKNQQMVYPNNIVYGNYTRSMKDFFYFNTDSTTYGTKQNNVIVDAGWAIGNKIILKLKSPTNDNYITYLPSSFQDNYSSQYNGPTLQNSRGMRALSFYTIPISVCPTTLIYNNVIQSSGTYTSSKSIESHAKVTNGVKYSAGKYILLLDGFQVNSSELFSAQIEGCP